MFRKLNTKTGSVWPFVFGSLFPRRQEATTAEVSLQYFAVTLSLRFMREVYKLDKCLPHLCGDVGAFTRSAVCFFCFRKRFVEAIAGCQPSFPHQSGFACAVQVRYVQDECRSWFH